MPVTFCLMDESRATAATDSMRILHFLRSARNDVGGPARAVVDLCAALSRRGHAVTLATIQGADLPEAGNDGGEQPFRLVQLPVPSWGGRYYGRKTQFAISELIRSHDLVHVHGVWDPVNIQLCICASVCQVPYFISIRGMLDAWSMRQSGIKKRIYLRFLGNRWLLGARRIHLTAQAELDQAAAWFPRSSGMVIPNLLDLRPFAQLPGAETALREFPSLPGRARLLFLSRLHPKKGLAALLRALQILKSRGILVCCIVAGGGGAAYVDSIERLAASLGLSSEDCRFTGPVVGPLKLSLYQSADLFVLPTSQENFGFVFIEALACGLPIVTTQGVDIWPELQASGAATIADGDPDTIAGAVAATLAKGGDLRRMGAQGREWAFREFDAAQIIERFEGMYRLALA